MSSASISGGFHWLATGLIALLLLGLMVDSAAGDTPPDPAEPMPIPVVVVTPWDGAYCAAEYPGGQSLVSVGSRVEADTVVCYIDSMRRFPVMAGVAGTVSQILAAEGELVEAGQPLMVIRPPLPPL